MAIRPVLRMGDARLSRIAEPVGNFGSDELHALLEDMRDTMQALNGVGLAAPQIGVNLRVVIFGVQPLRQAQDGKSPRYPDAEEVPQTVLINPSITALDGETGEDWEGCLSLPGCAGWCRACGISAIAAATSRARRSSARRAAFMRASCSTNAITWTASCTRCASTT